jgi:DNA mismatch endonuclease (patch repair protein)
MADTKTPAERSENMSRIRSTNTKPEEIVRKYLFSHGFRYRKNDKRYPGKPDIVLPKYRTIIFVNGCFWHMHGCSRSRLPRSNEEYWKPKIERNIKRDAENKQKLEAAGWNDYCAAPQCGCDLYSTSAESRGDQQRGREYYSKSGRHQ